MESEKKPAKKAPVKKVDKASDEILKFAEKHKRVIEKSKLSESFETLYRRFKYTENLER